MKKISTLVLIAFLVSTILKPEGGKSQLLMENWLLKSWQVQARHSYNEKVFLKLSSMGEALSVDCKLIEIHLE